MNIDTYMSISKPEFLQADAGIVPQIRPSRRVVQKVKTASTHALLADFAGDFFFYHPYSLDLA
jgi:hypothetical protein